MLHVIIVLSLKNKIWGKFDTSGMANVPHNPIQTYFLKILAMQKYTARFVFFLTSCAFHFLCPLDCKASLYSWQNSR